MFTSDFSLYFEQFILPLQYNKRQEREGVRRRLTVQDFSRKETASFGSRFFTTGMRYDGVINVDKKENENRREGEREERIKISIIRIAERQLDICSCQRETVAYRVEKV